MQRHGWWKVLWILACVALISPAAHALDDATVQQLVAEDSEIKLDAINKLVVTGDPAVLALLQAMQADALQVLNGRAVLVTESGYADAVTGAPIAVGDAQPETIIVNNRARGALDSAIASLRLLAPDRAARLAAATAVAADPNPEMRPLIEVALSKETDADVKAQLAQAKARLDLASSDTTVRREAVKVLGESENRDTKQLLNALLAKSADGVFAEPDAEVRAEAVKAIRAIDKRFVIPQLLGTMFYGLSLGSVLLLAALGLAISFGLMGVINMAHGEFLMIGAYATYVVQSLFRSYLPGLVDWYLLAALPVAFIAAAAVGALLERSVIRFLYGRPLETLLATWGVSLVLIQFVRFLFGPQNVEVANPVWMSGGITAGPGLVLPWNRIFIVLFAAAVVAMVWAMLNRTRLGLYVRAVTQNRAMADCMGVPTPRVDLIAFSLGAGIAGLGGVALSQIGNVGPDLGQSYIVDSFMVVVLGGVGQLAGTVVAAFGLGEVNKFLEPYAGAVLAKIAVLVFIILFIQKRPHGLFALKGRMADA